MESAFIDTVAANCGSAAMSANTTEILSKRARQHNMPPKSRGGRANVQNHGKNGKLQISSQEDSSSKRIHPPVQLQQKLLDVFRNAFPSRFEPDLPAWLQEVKRFLYQRDFNRAFGRDEYREAYAVRWSPSRALGYVDILEPIISKIYEQRGRRDVMDIETKEPTLKSKDKGIRVSCIGGGAGAEIVALAAVLKLHNWSHSSANCSQGGGEVDNENTSEGFEDNGLSLSVDFIDIADWSSILDRLYQTITSPPPLSAYASAKAKAKNVPLILPTSYNVVFSQHDILKLHPRELYPLVGTRDMVTLLFTLNELYTTSSLLTQTFLLNLTACMAVGSLLLVVDSAGDYTEVGFSREETKKYPMQWLADRTLLTSATEVGFSHPIEGPGDDESAEHKRERKYREGRAKDSVKWEKIREENSKWFRLAEGLTYPVELENMRYQLHLYRRISHPESS